MNNWLTILIYLLEHKEHSFTINQIAKALKINYRIAYQETKRLSQEKLINIVKVGNSNQCSLTNEFNEKIFSAENERRNMLLKNKNFKVLCKRISSINKQFILILFGSFAAKKQSKGSDIDLLLIKKKKKKIEEIINLIPLPIHLNSIKYEDFINMLKTKEKTVV